MVTQNRNQENRSRFDSKTIDKVWIVSHGWYANPNSSDYDTNYMQTLATRLDENLKKQGRNNDVVLLLDWREASNTCCQIPPKTKDATPWIKPVAREASVKLKLWGIKDGNKLNFVGHSLGTYMSAEIAREFGQGNTAILLDPASEAEIGEVMILMETHPIIKQ